MVLDIPAEIARLVSPSDLKLDLALGMYASGRITVGQGARMCGLSHAQFQLELGRRQIPAHYGEDDLRRDLDSLEPGSGL